jgi:signal transduction histidine kinase/CheY-like chemotaxis protein
MNRILHRIATRRTALALTGLLFLAAIGQMALSQWSYFGARQRLALQFDNLAKAQATAVAAQVASLGEDFSTISKSDFLAQTLANTHTRYARCFMPSEPNDNCGTYGVPSAQVAQIIHPEAIAGTELAVGTSVIAVVQVPESSQSKGKSRAPRFLILENDHEAEIQALALDRWLNLGTELAALLCLLMGAILARYYHAMTTSMIAQAREARDEAQAESRTKSMFLANMSHELRTPMNGVLGMADLLLGSGLTQKQRKYANTIRRSGHALLAIINDVLDFSRVESGQLTLEYAEFDPRDRIEDVVEPLRVVAEEKGVEIEVRCRPEVPANIVGDPNRLQQVLTNLIGNAVKFTPHGRIVVEVDIAENHGHTATLRFAVTDSGIGIADENIAKLFRAFSQGDASMNRRFGGSGLGLAISRQLVRLMGGDIEVKSVLGSGSTFTFTAQFTIPESSTMLIRPPLTGISALVIAESGPQRHYLAQLLELWAVAVTTASTPEMARETIRASHALNDDPSNHYDVLLIDRISPTVDAITFALQLVEDGDLLSESVLILSAPGKTTAADLEAARVASVLNKPLRQGQLYDALRTVRAKRRAAGDPSLGDAQGRKVGVEVLDQSLGVPKIGPGADFSGEGAVEISQSEGPAPGRNPDENQKLRILVAEDNETNTEVVTALLDNLGYIYETVNNGRECLRRATSGTAFDLILMDCQMPEMDGYEAAIQIRAWERRSRSRKVPIIALTAHATVEHQRQAMFSGMNAHIAKPLDVEKLADTIHIIVRSAAASSTPDAKATETVAQGLKAHISRSKLNKLRRLESPSRPNFFAKLVTTYLEQSQQTFEALREAVQGADVKSIREHAHTLAGSSDYVAATQLATYFRTIEELGHDPAQANALIPLVSNEYLRVRQALAVELKRATPATADATDQDAAANHGQEVERDDHETASGANSTAKIAI